MTLILKGAPERVDIATEQIRTIAGIPGVAVRGSLEMAVTEADLFPGQDVEWPLDTYAPDSTGKYDTRPRDIDVMATRGDLTLEQLHDLLNSGLHRVDPVVQSHLIPSLWGHGLGKSLLLPIKGFPREAGRIIIRDAGGDVRIPTLPLETQAILASLALRPESDKKYHESARKLAQMVVELRSRPDAPRAEFIGLLAKWRLHRLKWTD